MNFSQQLSALKEKQLFRERVVRTSKVDRYVSINGTELLNFNSNDYLGLSAHPAILMAAREAAVKMGHGSTGSPLMSGYTAIHQQLEYAMASFLGFDRVLLFSSGYLANLAVAQALLRRDDWLIEDKLNHASLIDASLLAKTQLKRYPHLNINKCEQILQLKGNKEAMIATDGVFSMDGDCPDLHQLSELAKKHGVLLWVDDAHGLAVSGDSGRGTLERQGLNSEHVSLLSGTFGKAFGGVGAFVAGSDELIEMLIQKGRTYRYNTSMPVPDAAANLKALDVVQSEPWRREKVLDLIDYFRQQIISNGLEGQMMDSDSAIQPLSMGNENEALKKAAYLLDRGIYVSAIRPPTVPANQSRLRFTLTAYLEKEDIDILIQCLIGNY